MLVLVVRLGRFFGICWGTSFSLTNLTGGLDESDPFCHQAACGDCLVSLVMPHEGRFCWRCWGGGVACNGRMEKMSFFNITAPIKAYILLDTVDGSELLHQLRLVVVSHYLQGFIHPWCRISSNSMCCEQQALLIWPKKMASIGSSTSHHALVGNDNDSTPLKVNAWDHIQVKREIMFKPALFGFNILIFQGENNYDHLNIWNCKG